LGGSFIWVPQDIFLGSLENLSLREPFICHFSACRETKVTDATVVEQLNQYCKPFYKESGKGQCNCETGEDCYIDDKEERDAANLACARECRIERKEYYYKAITKGFELVFGDKPSVGFICGIKNAVVNNEKPIPKDLPGECCLDAPYQLDNKNWGNKVSLELDIDSKRTCYDD
jgi:hypothetical protein